MTQIVLIHGGESTATKLAAALPGARVAVVYRQGLSEVYDEKTGIAKEYPTLRGLLSVFAPEWKPGEPLVVLGYSAGAWALRYYLRDASARADITAAIFLDGLYGAPGGVCNMAPYQGVLAYAKEANANPASKRLVMTYSKSYPGPDACSEAIKAAAPGPAVFTVPANNADHGAQQGVVGPAVVKDLIAPWIGGSSSAVAAKKSSWGWVIGGALLVAGAWYFTRKKAT